MKISISNIAWTAQYDREMYCRMAADGIQGLEIAPSRLWKMPIYEKVVMATNFANQLYTKYGLSISSMQSIWFGRSERIFHSKAEYDFLVQYTKQAIDFAAALSCKNLVFGCPQNRWIFQKEQYNDALLFFDYLGDYALKRNVVIAIEPNPPIYGTNFINCTKEAFEIVKELDNPGIKVNLDVGTMIENGESCQILQDKLKYVHHVHISEPNLLPIKRRKIHIDLAQFLKMNKYEGYVSVEMKNAKSLPIVIDCLKYVQNLFDGEK